MLKFHINPETGEPGRCIAIIKCKYNADESKHYGSKEDARKAYEDQMSYDNLPNSVITGRNLSQMAKTASKKSEIKIVLQYGGAYEMTHLARNPNVPAEYLTEIWEKSETEKRETLKYMIALHPNCPVTLLDKPRLIHLGGQNTPAFRQQMKNAMSSDDVTNEQAGVVADRGFAGSAEILANHKTRISQENMRKLAFKNSTNLRLALSNPRFDKIAALSDAELTPERLHDFYTTSPSENDQAFIYNHVNCPESLKSHLEKTLSDLEVQSV